jgi:hypothetical protein
MGTTALCMVLAAVGQLWAGRGAAELALDRSAVATLIEVALPQPRSLVLSGLGRLTLVVGPPQRVAFHEGGVEASLALGVAELDLMTDLRVRYVPAVEPLTGVVRLVAESAEPSLRLPFAFDFAAWLAPVELPRRLDWVLPFAAGGDLDVTCFVQRVTIEPERLRVELSVDVRRRPLEQP